MFSIFHIQSLNVYPKTPVHPDKTPTKSYDWNFGIVTRSNVITIQVEFTLMPNEITSAIPDLVTHRMPGMTSLVTITVVTSTYIIRRQNHIQLQLMKLSKVVRSKTQSKNFFKKKRTCKQF